MLKKITLTLYLSLLSLLVFSQKGTLKGVITDSKGEGILQANVIVDISKGLATASGIDGDYELELEAGKYLILYKSLSKKDKIVSTIIVAGETKIQNVVLEDYEEEHATILLGMGEQEYIQVGRGTQSGNDIIMGENDKTVSRTHVRITAHKQGFFVEDLSTMGTYVDGQKIEKNKKKFVNSKNNIVLGKKNCVLDLAHFKIQSLLGK